jgi:NTE family protein
LPRLLLSICLVALVAPSTWGQQPPAGEAGARRGELALVLSGGGARGAAHIGVLRVLEQHHVVPDRIVGTSMGAVVGGLYAAGYSPDEIEQVLQNVDWHEIFFDRVARRNLPFRRKQDDTPFFVPFRLRFHGWKPYMPSGLLAGQRLEFMLRRLVLEATSEDDFDDLPIPFRAVAMDIATSNAVVLGRGNLADAIRASMSIPGAFTPVTIDGRMLVDGGSAANLPIRIARDLGADRIIAVNISTPLDTSLEERSFVEVLNQLTGFLTSGSVQADLQLLGPDDLLITPELGDITFRSFERAAEAVAIGETAASGAAERLERFAAPPERWAAFEERHVRHDATALPVDQVVLDYDGWVDRRVVERRIDIPRGQPFDAVELERQVTELRGLGYFGLVRYELAPEADGSRVALDIDPPHHGRANLQFGGSLRTDFAGDSSYAILARHQWLAVNSRGGEWVNTFQGGDRVLFATEFHQPLDWGLRWYVRPRLEDAEVNQSLWEDGRRVAEYRVEDREATLRFGRYFGRSFDLHATFFRGEEQGEPRIGISALPSFDQDTGGIRIGFDVDDRDRAMFPKHGTDLRVWIERSLAGFGATADATVADVRFKTFFTLGRGTLSPRAEGRSNVTGEANVASSALVGGFQRLSGLGDNELIGDHGGVLGIDYWQEWFTFGQGSLGGRVFAGASVEAGNVWEEGELITWSSLRTGGALWVGAATPLGPLYLGWGYTEPDRQRAYLIIGDRF